MFLACFCDHQYSRGKAVAANHLPPTQHVIVTSRIRPAHASVTSRKLSIRHASFAFILIIIIFLLLVLKTRGVKKLEKAKIKMSDGHRSGRSTGRVSCKNTELKRCSMILLSLLLSLLQLLLLLLYDDGGNGGHNGDFNEHEVLISIAPVCGTTTYFLLYAIGHVLFFPVIRRHRRLIYSR